MKIHSRKSGEVETEHKVFDRAEVRRVSRGEIKQCETARPKERTKEDEREWLLDESDGREMEERWRKESEDGQKKEGRKEGRNDRKRKGAEERAILQGSIFVRVRSGAGVILIILCTEDAQQDSRENLWITEDKEIS